MESKVWRIIDILNWGKEFFSEKGIDSPRLNIELMLCSALSLNRIDLYTKYEQPLVAKELDKLRDMVKRRAKREPLQHILEYEEFFGYKFLVNRNVLIPRPETELLVEKILQDISNHDAELNILDIGSGSGCISISLAKNLPNAKITAMDISNDAIGIMKENIILNNVNNVTPLQFDILNQQLTEKYDLIVSNPPYIPKNEMDELEVEVKDHEPSAALTDMSDGLTFYKKFSQIFRSHLNENARFYLEFGYGQKTDLLNIFQENGYLVEIFNDYANIPRILKGGIIK